MDSLAAATLLNRLQGVDIKQLKDLAQFLASPEGQTMASQLDAATKVDPVKEEQNYQAEYAKRRARSADNLNLLRTTMGLTPTELALKTALALASEAPRAAGDIAMNNAQSKAERRLVGLQTDAQRNTWGTSPASIAKQRYASNEIRKGKNWQRGLNAIGNVIGTVAGARNAADTAARMQAAAGGERLSTGGYWALNKMLGLMR